MKTLDILKSVWNTTAIRTSLFIIACVVCIFTVIGLGRFYTEPSDVCIFVIIIPLLFCSISRGISIKYYFLYAIPLLPLAYSTCFMPQGYTLIFSSFILLIITLIYIAKKTVQWEYKKKTLWIISNLIITIAVWIFTLGFNPFVIGSKNIHNHSRLMQAWSYSIVEKDGKWGIVDAITGETIIPIKFDSIIYDKGFSLYSIQPHLVNNDITIQNDLLYNNHDTIFISLDSAFEERIKNGLRAEWDVRKTENKEMAIRDMKYIRMGHYAYGDLRKLFINRFDNDTTTSVELKHFNELENIVIDNLNYVLDSLIVKKANNANLDFNDISELRLSLSRAIGYSTIKYTLYNDTLDINTLGIHLTTISHYAGKSNLTNSFRFNDFHAYHNYNFESNPSDYLNSSPIELNEKFITSIFSDRSPFLNNYEKKERSLQNIKKQLEFYRKKLSSQKNRFINNIDSIIKLYKDIEELRSLMVFTYNLPADKLDTLIFDKTPKVLLNILDTNKFELNDYDTAIQDICSQILYNATIRGYNKEDEIERLLVHMKSSDKILESTSTMLKQHIDIKYSFDSLSREYEELEKLRTNI